MPLIELTNENFDDETEKYPINILDFWSPTCAPCLAFLPLFEAISARHPDILFGKVNTEAEPTLARQFEIFSVPTVLAAKDGTIVYARPGSLNETKLESLIQDVRNQNVPS